MANGYLNTAWPAAAQATPAGQAGQPAPLNDFLTNLRLAYMRNQQTQPQQAQAQSGQPMQLQGAVNPSAGPSGGILAQLLGGSATPSAPQPSIAFANGLNSVVPAQPTQQQGNGQAVQNGQTPASGLQFVNGLNVWR